MSEAQRAAEELEVAIGESSLGLVLAAKSAVGLSAVLLGDDADELRRELQGRFPTAALVDAGVATTELLAWVVDFVDSSANDVDIPLDIRGTDFQRRVWQALREIPAGRTASYAEIAR